MSYYLHLPTSQDLLVDILYYTLGSLVLAVMSRQLGEAGKHSLYCCCLLAEVQGKCKHASISRVAGGGAEQVWQYLLVSSLWPWRVQAASGEFWSFRGPFLGELRASSGELLAGFRQFLAPLAVMHGRFLATVGIRGALVEHSHRLSERILARPMIRYLKIFLVDS